MKLKLWVKVCLIFLLCGGLYFSYQFFNKDDQMSQEAKNVLKEFNIPKDKYSKALEFALQNNMYDEKYLEEYKDIQYENVDHFKDALSFLAKGYKGKEINYILALSDQNFEKLKKIDYVNLENYYSFKNFDVLKLDRYNKYKETHQDVAYKDVVTYVNIKLDLPVYTDTITVDNPSSLLVLVNKYNSLPKDYKPNTTSTLPGAYKNNVPMRVEAKEALEKLQKAVKEEANFTLLPTTAYRDYNFQNTLYTNYVKDNGKEKADTFSARPGYSDHQTGLAIDLKNPAREKVRLSDSDYEWLHHNAHRFGFIIRFPKGKEFITGYQFENWHIRYVGNDVAKIIYENDLTLEEYIDLYVTTY